MLQKDLSLAWRTLGKNPAFAIGAIVTIALGIGASTAIFSVTNAVLLRPLPYKESDRLFFVISEMRKRNVKNFPFSSADFIDLRNATASTFETISALDTGRSAVPKQDGSLEEIRWAAVTPDFFRLMGARILVGRDFAEADGQQQSSSPLVTILSHEYWKRRYGGDASILGQSAPGTRPGSTQIIGVLEPGFQLLFPPDSDMEQAPDQWFVTRLAYDNATRNNAFLRVIGRLRPGVTQHQAQSSVEAFAEALRKQWTSRQGSDFHIRLEPMQRHLVEAVRPTLLVVSGAGIFLLLIVCANVANLLLVRVSMREREFAVRTALGGSWWRLVLQLSAEALLISATGAVLGVGLASMGIDRLRAVAPASLPRPETIRIDLTALAFTAFTAIAVAVLFGMMPAWRASRPDIATLLRASGRTTGLGRSGLLRSGVVVVEVALSFVLLIGSGLMFRSLWALHSINPGYDAAGLLTLQLYGSRGGNLPAQRAAFMSELQERLRSLPGVKEVTASNPFPLAGGFYGARWGTEQALSDPSKFQNADSQTVLPGYFETLRTPLVAGRTFAAEDNAPGRNVVIIDEYLAAKAFPGESAIGKRIIVRSTNTPVEVIGVVAHQRATSLTHTGREQIYFTDGFMGHGVVSRWAIRTVGSPEKYMDAVRAEISKLGSRLVLTDMQTMEQLVERAKAGTRFSLLLLGVFAVLAALLASVGLYGVLSTIVRQRTAEIGVRMAMGAEPATIFKLVVGYGLRLSAAGIAVGLLVTTGFTRLISSMLVGITATDPATFVCMAAVFLLIAALASWLPARRAAGLDPTAALRE